MKSNKIESETFFVLKNLLAIAVMLVIITVVSGLALQQKESGNSGEIIDKKSDMKPIPIQEKIIVPKVIYNLSGRISKIDGNTVIFNAEIYSVDEKGARSVREEERRALVNYQTKFSSLSFVNRSPVDKIIKLSDLKPGDYAEILSSSDISNAKEFLATQIRIKTSL